MRTSQTPLLGSASLRLVIHRAANQEVCTAMSSIALFGKHR
jgi:hypothetical protein